MIRKWRLPLAVFLLGTPAAGLLFQWVFGSPKPPNPPPVAVRAA